MVKSEHVSISKFLFVTRMAYCENLPTELLMKL